MPTWEYDIRGSKVLIEAADEREADTKAVAASQQPQHFAFDESRVPASQRTAGSDPYDESWFAQVMSGGNEGLATGLGAPVDIVNAGIGLGMRGINKAAGTDLQPSAEPFLGSEFFKKSMGPAIREETDDPSKQFARRVAKSTGAAVPFAAAAPAAVLASGAGGGVGAATANELFPDNPTAEMIGELVGSLGTVGATAWLKKSMADRAAKAAAPNLNDLRTTKTAAYKAVDDAGVTYSPQSLDDLIAGISDEMSAARINQVRHPKAFSMLEDIKSKIVTGEQPTLSDIDTLRQVIRRDVANSADEAERFFGEKMIANIDEFVNATTGKQLVSGNADEAASSIRAARDSNRRLKNYERITTAATKAERRAASTGSGGNIENASRQNIRQILDDPRKARFYSPQERAAMDKIVMGTKTQNAARQVGKLSPSGNGLQQALALGATAYNPAMAAFPGVGMIAKFLADRGTNKSIEDLLATIASGGPIQNAPMMTDEVKQLLKAWAATQSALATTSAN